MLQAAPGGPEPEPAPEVLTTETMDADRNRIFDSLDADLQNQSDTYKVPVIVMLTEPATEQTLNDLQEAIGTFTVTSNRDEAGFGQPWTLIPAFAATITRAQIFLMANQSGVKHVEESFPIEPYTDFQSYQTLSGVTKVHDDFGYDGDMADDSEVGEGNHAYSTDDVVACVLDTGIDVTHPDLDEGQVLAFKDFLNVTVDAAEINTTVNVSLFGTIALWVDAEVHGTLSGTMNGASFVGTLDGAYIATLSGTFNGLIDGRLNGTYTAAMHYNSAGDSLSWPHGTWVSGILAGQGDLENVTAESTLPGVAPGTALVVARVNEDPVLQSANATNLIDGFEWCVDQKDTYNIQLISFSGGLLVDPIPYDCPDGTDATSIAANNSWSEGLVVVIAAANLGSGYCTITSPGLAQNVITVGAINDPLNPWTEQGRCVEDSAATKGWYLWTKSSRGHAFNIGVNASANYGAVKPELVAPGVCITAPSPLQPQACGHRSGFCTASGTSFATPFVAATVALMLHGNASLTNDEAKRFLMQSTDTWGPPLYSYPVPRNYDYGAGRVDVYAAVNTSGATYSTGFVPNPKHYKFAEELDASNTIDYIFDRTNLSWWISTTIIVPGSREPDGSSGTLQAILKPNLLVPSVNCPPVVASTSSAVREVQLSYDINHNCGATTFKLTLLAVSHDITYWFDAVYGGATPTTV
jgi:subtilisin family serine protease